jgi:hypothetical protein
MKALKPVLLTVLFWMLSTSPAPALNETEKAPKIVVDRSTYEFEQVSQGDIVTHDFLVRNQGTATLEIKKVKPG